MYGRACVSRLNEEGETNTISKMNVAKYICICMYVYTYIYIQIKNYEEILWRGCARIQRSEPESRLGVFYE